MIRFVCQGAKQAQTFISSDIYKYDVRSYLADAAVRNHYNGIVRKKAPDASAARHHNLLYTALTFIKFQIAYMPQPLTFLDTDDFFSPKFAKTHTCFTGFMSLPYLMS